jgi:ketosteroid isomerase-like protein
MIEEWVQGYLKAWASDEPSDVGALFTDDARYFTEPYAEPWVGREQIVREWIARGDSGNRWSFDHEVLVECGDVGVVRGVTHYGPETAADSEGKTYHNLWLVRLAPDGRAREFTEWWMKAR